MSEWGHGAPLLDAEHEEAGVEYVPSKITDFSKIRLEPPLIRYKLYAQDGAFVEMEVEDTYSNRLLVSWVQIHDRYVVHGPGGRRP